MAKRIKFNQDQLQKALLKKIFAWVDVVMKEELPSHIYDTAHKGKPSERLSTGRWLMEQGYRVVTQPDGEVQIFKGTKLVRRTKMVLELDDPEELLSVMEVVQDNVNIPAPPWDPKSKGAA